jgi:hypothetical protein
MNENPKVTLNVLIDYIRINQVKTTYTSLASTLTLVAIGIVIYMQNQQAYIAAIVLVAFAIFNFFGSKKLKTNLDLILHSKFDLNKADYEYFLHRYQSNRIVNILLLVFSVIFFLTAIITPTILIYFLSHPYNYLGLLFPIISISLHLYLTAKTNSKCYNEIKTKLDQLYG